MIIPRIVSSVAGHASRQPAAPALIWRNQPVTYADLERRTTELHDEIRRRGIKAPQPVAIAITTSPDAIALILACRRAGVPVLMPSTDLPPAILNKLMTQAGCQYRLAFTAEGRLTLEPPAGRVVATVDGASAAFLLTTSGSTGVPKIVSIPSEAIDRFTDWAGERFGIGAGTRVLNYAPLNFDLCFLDIWTTLARGGCVLLTERNRAADGRYLLDVITAGRPHVIQAVPMLFQLLLAARRDTDEQVTSVSFALYSGDSAPTRMLESLPELFPNARVGNLYGCTEINDAFLYEFDPTHSVPCPVPLGTAVPGVQWLLVDDAGNHVTGPGIGELWVHTPFQSNGYLDHRLNEGKFSGHPDASSRPRYFRTGDLVRRTPQGTLFLEGRNDFQVKVRGTQVNPQAVERALLEHSGVLEAAVVPVTDALGGHRLCAVVRRSATAGLTTLQLRSHCSARLSRPAIPSLIRVVDHPLPRTSTGKIDRAAVRRTHLSDAS